MTKPKRKLQRGEVELWATQAHYAPDGYVALCTKRPRRCRDERCCAGQRFDTPSQVFAICERWAKRLRIRISPERPVRMRIAIKEVR